MHYDEFNLGKKTELNTINLKWLIRITQILLHFIFREKWLKLNI